MTWTARVLGVLAGLLLVTALGLMVTPNRGRPVIDVPQAGVLVDCGTPFRTTRWSSDDGCEGAVLARGGLVILAGLGAIVVGAGAVGVYLVAGRRG